MAETIQLTEALKDEAVRIIIERNPNGYSSSRDISGHVVWKAAYRIEQLENTLSDLIETFKPRATHVDHDYGSDVRALGDIVGYGVLMSSASALWREKLIASGVPAGGEFSCGPCVGTVEAVLDKARSVLEANSL